MFTWHIHIKGQVQGVGFRPFVYRLAQQFALCGWVNNGKDGVHIEFNANREVALVVRDRMEKEAPELAIITSIELDQVQNKTYQDFSIKESEVSGAAHLLLTPDFAICDDCRSELDDPLNRRAAYPFTTCTNCGPRFSIIHHLPYDRRNTTMDTFEMCSACLTEYLDPTNRRYYSQTNSCPNCRIEMALYDTSGSQLKSNDHQILTRVVESWQQGKIVAIKGIGGYLLTGAANNEHTIKLLRKRKQRPSKPFALMYPGVATLRRFDLSEKIINLLQSPVSPIVLLDKLSDKNTDQLIAPGLNQLGVMLPYTPLFELLLKKFQEPIIATSGNLSNASIIYEDEQALSELLGIADLVLINNRKIVLAQDDSVFRFSTFKKKQILIRRSRGLAPTYLNPGWKAPDESIFAAGAMLKSTFTILHQSNLYKSPYQGDLDHFDAQLAYQKNFHHFNRLLDTNFDMILCDSHPDYASTHFAAEWAEKKGVPLLKIQHHLAHFGAILGEHNLLHSVEPVLGVIWDGTGYGEDGQIWGGEFFEYKNYSFQRIAHLNYFPAIFGDKMPKEPRISALSTCWGIEGAEDILIKKFTKTEWQIYNKLLQKEHSLQTSSVGRLFDAVASLLGIMDKQTYEGEAAMRLEALATGYCNANGLNIEKYYSLEIKTNGSLSINELLKAILKDVKLGVATALIAAKFHYSLIGGIQHIAEKCNCKKIACSGGVFQNALLVDMIIHHLGKDYDLYFHEQLAPNDENISFGQLVCYQIQKQKEFTNFKINKIKGPCA